MAPTNADILSSKVFFFDVGSEDVKSFAIHSELICRHSPVFKVMISGEMKEAIEGRVGLDDVDQDTFVRCAEYLYGGDYNPAEALVVLEKDPDPPVEVIDGAESVDHNDNPLSDIWDVPSKVKPKKQKKVSKTKTRTQDRPLESLEDIVLPKSKSKRFPAIHHTRYEPGLMYDYTEVLSHVKLYAFAEKYQMSNLRRLILAKLRTALDETPFHPSRIDDFSEILAVAYDSTPDVDKEPLRNLLTVYGAWNFKHLVESLGFQDFVQNYGQCVVHLSQKVARRL